MAQKPKILVVEDEQASLRQLEMTLKTMGANPVCFTSSRKAAEVINKQKFDGAFLDWETPDISGEELTKRIRESRSNAKMPVAMITERSDTHSIARGFELGVMFFLSKPVGQTELQRLLNASRGAMLEERRRYQRAPVRAPVACATDEKKVGGHSVDLSASGILVELPEVLEVGAQVTLDFKLPRLEPLSLSATVVRTTPGPRVGLHFERMSREQRDTLKFFVERQLSPLRRNR